MHILSWGGVGGEIASLARPAFSCEIRERLCRVARGESTKQLIIGNLRSYGDEVICPDGNYLQTTSCDRILQVDTQAGTVTAESGVRLDVLQNRVASFGYMLPVTPGTSYLTLGGAIANDVHGKNHHRAGTFGCFVLRLELVRTSGEVLLCSPSENPEFFASTIGGVGLTGAITRAMIQLRRVDSPFLRVRSRRFRDLDEFFDLDLESKDQHECSVAWIDCAAKGRSLGRCIYSVADHAARLHRTGARSVHYANWLYPLDAIGSWNRLYGRRRFFQFQCAVPPSEARSSIAEMLKAIAAAGRGSLLVVLKNFGDKASPGLMSFPMAGATLAVDFPNRGKATRELLLELYRITASARGRLYPAKDACSPPETLEMGYSNFARFKQLLDPGLESSMSRRLALTE